MKKLFVLFVVLFLISCKQSSKVSNVSPVIKSVLVGGHKMVYSDRGSGDVIVLIHGLSGNMNNYAGIIPELAKTNRVIAVDLLGNGKSDKPDISYSMKSKAASIKVLLDFLKIKKAIIAGHSNGGAVGLRFAIEYPTRLTKLILIAPGGLIKISPAMAVLFKGYVKKWVNDNYKSKENTVKLFKTLVYKWTPRWEKFLGKRLKLMDTPKGKKNLELEKRATLRTVLSSVDDTVVLPDKYKTIRVPILFLLGNHDPLIPGVGRTMDDLMKFIDRYFVNKKIVRLECAHMVQMELPDKAYEAIYGFIR